MKFFARISPAGIRMVRRRLALTQHSFGRLLGVSGPAVSMWERGKREPGALHTAVLEQMLRMTEEDGELRDALGLISSKPLAKKWRGPVELAKITLGVLFCREPAYADPARYVQLQKGTVTDADS